MKVLITGGSTWVKIDRIRIITNIFTGRTSLLLAKHFLKKGIKVTLIVNPSWIKKFPKDKNLRIIFFKYFRELQNILKKELKKNTYKAVIHNAAVSDYTLEHSFNNKIPSKRKSLYLRLKPTPKLTHLIYSLAKKSLLVQFKLETTNKNIIKKSYESLKRNKFDIVIANVFSKERKKYHALLIDRHCNIKKISSKKDLAQILFHLIKFFK